jgi:hypothetical protein
LTRIIVGGKPRGGLTRIIVAYYRQIMQFFYEIALVTEDRTIEELFYRVWTKGQLSIIPDLIIPQETFVTIAPDGSGQVHMEIVPEQQYKKVLRLLKRLYDRAPDDADLR